MSKTATDGHRELPLGRELSLEELEAVSGGDTLVEIAGHKVTTSDVPLRPSGCGTSSSSPGAKRGLQASRLSSRH